MERDQTLVTTFQTAGGGTPLPILRTFFHSGPDGIEFDIEQGIQDGLSVSQDGRVETFAPEGPPSLMGGIVPSGVGLIDVAHEFGDIEQTAIETVPLLIIAKDLIGIFVDEQGALAQVLSREDLEGEESEDQVIVIVHEAISG